MTKCVDEYHPFSFYYRDRKIIFRGLLILLNLSVIYKPYDILLWENMLDYIRVFLCKKELSVFCLIQDFEINITGYSEILTLPPHLVSTFHIPIIVNISLLSMLFSSIGGIAAITPIASIVIILLFVETVLDQCTI